MNLRRLFSGNTLILILLIALALWQGPALVSWGQLQLFKLGLSCPSSGVLLLIGGVVGVVIRSLL